MGKVLQFKRVKQEAPSQREAGVQMPDFEDDISAVINDHSLTAANRHWILENMLMNIDDRLEEYKRELEKAEIRLNELVNSAQGDIAQAYRDFEAHVSGMTRAVRKLTSANSCQAANVAAGNLEQY